MTDLRPAFQVQVRVERGGIDVTVAVIGELDAAVAPALTDALLAACSDGRRHVSVDATHLTFIDSAGLQSLVRVLRHVRRNGGAMTVLGATSSVRRVLDISGFATLSGAIVP